MRGWDSDEWLGLTWGVVTNIRDWNVQNKQYLITSERSEAQEKMGADAPRSSSYLKF